MKQLFQEIRKRHVFRVAGGYAVVGWLLIQLGIALETTLNLPGWFDTVLTVLVLIGFPIALMLAWAFEVTPDGVKRTTSSKGPTGNTKFGFVDIAILIALISLVGVTLYGPTRPSTPTAVNISPDTSQAQVKSIAVLPFADMSSTKDQEYFSDGMAEEILNALVKVPELQVSGRTSSFAFKDRNDDIQTIGEALNVAHILEGSVRKQGNRVRITAQLIQVSNGFHMWSDTYDGTLDNIFDLQENVARAVTDELELVLIGGNAVRLADVATSSTEAYDLLLRARAVLRNQVAVAEFKETEALLQEALKIDPNLAEGWDLMASLSLRRAGYDGSFARDKAFETIRLATKRQIEIAPDSPATLKWQSAVNLWSGGGFAAIFRDTKVALERHPNAVDPIFGRGILLGLSGYSSEAKQLYERMVEIEPLRSEGWRQLGLAAQNIGDYEGAERYFLRAYELGDSGVLPSLAANDFMRHDPDAAKARLLQAYDQLGDQVDSEFSSRALWEAASRALYDDSAADIQALRRVLSAQYSAPDYQATGLSLGLAARLGMSDDFFKLYPRAHFGRNVIGHRMWNDFDWARDIRQHPGFPAFVEEQGFLAIWQEYGWPDKCRPDPGTDGSDGKFSCD